MIQTLVELGGLFALGLLCNGPYSPLLPVATEPVVIVYGKLYPPLLVAAVTVAAALAAEIYNWRLYGAALASRRLARLRDSRLARLVTRHFASAPFITTLACAILPVPFWLARCSAIVTRYPVRRFLVALTIGRLVWWWSCAALGSAIPVGAGWLAAGCLALSVMWIVLSLAGRSRRAESTC